ESQLASLFGGRIAEEIIFGPESVTTGASNDIKRATDIARNMVTRWGLSERLGPLTYGDEEGEVFLGHSMNKRKDISDVTAHVIDEEIRSIVDRTYELARKVLLANVDKLHIMAEALLKYETIDAEQLRDVMEGREPREPSDWSNDDRERSKKKSDESKNGSVHRAIDSYPDNRDPAPETGK
ncbi:MAG: cell division protein FtsH, partial [Erysipelotrichaceae bacterium]|nr:cell division protein FtsH [Erysipelotrichaceae bacterium]